MDLNNRRTGKHATKPRALGLLGHCGFYQMKTRNSLLLSWVHNFEIGLSMVLIS